MVTVAVQFVVGRLVMRRLQDTDSSALSLHHELQLVHKMHGSGSEKTPANTYMTDMSIKSNARKHTGQCTNSRRVMC
ncbi:hypothetical protein EB796_014942 [Bugula neritina]|uniref:Uncharacterized protein n=1 Tax=Bugula neritina TaxID=10212 RepID=A0A7J7JKB5_BUGNE|nr:hypothetical protein EB796_014942 [Bugula neritina]